MHPRLAILLDLLDEAFDHKAWHGPTLFGSVRGMPESDAAWRPGAGRHNAWEIVVHAAYWKYTVRRRLAGEKRGTFGLAGSNWFARPFPGASWRNDLRLLVEEHGKLRRQVAGLPPAALDRAVERTGTAAFLIRGIAAHDLYHAGQIQLIKRLMRA